MDRRTFPLSLLARSAHAVATRATGRGLLSLVLLCLLADGAWAQVSPRAASVPQRAASATTESTPRWSELSTSQRQALKPLASAWTGLSVDHKRKWIALSRNFKKLPPAEQQKLHARMSEWATLSPRERIQARLNFVATEKLSIDDKQAKWEAYQALSDDERHRLAEQAPRRVAPGAAAAVRPVPKSRLTTAPTTADNSPMPRISAAPHLIDRNTLLPQLDRYNHERDGSPTR